MNRRHAMAAMTAWAALPAAAPAATAVTAGDLRDDIAILRQALALHPGLYRYASPREVAERIDRLEQVFLAARSIEARYLALSRFLATIRCGHSYCNFFNQSDAAARTLFDRPTRLPFRFEWIGGRMIVTDASAADLPAGSEVVTVNGLPAGRMLEALIGYARADGHNDAKRIALLGVSGSDRIEYFDVFHGLVFGAPRDGVHRLDVRMPDGRERTVAAPAIGLAQRQARMAIPAERGDRPAWTWSMGADGIAVLTMPDWALYDSAWDWRAWLDERLGTLGGARGLIVDLRANEGGLDCGDALLARLSDQPIVDPRERRLVRFTRTPEAIRPHLDTWDHSFHSLGVGARPVGNGFLQLVGDRGEDVIAPVGPRITVPVAALIGPVNSSATFQFAQKARRTGLVRLFGETSGGNRRGINGGCFFFVRLPASGIEFDLPLIGYFPPGLPPDAGIEPDVRVLRSAADIAAGRDPAREAAAAWIRRA
ncbi:S41 family peptidase [Sphingomonas sp. HF-S3]|uniref:S41 family peptidase n=1 Tax=Sphingomonas rustica TaxID=3103142 RepID=A0ABV0B9N9_9SPHN